MTSLIFVVSDFNVTRDKTAPRVTANTWKEKMSGVFMSYCTVQPHTVALNNKFKIDTGVYIANLKKNEIMKKF
jgi:hypothetical protein